MYLILYSNKEFFEFKIRNVDIVGKQIMITKTDSSFRHETISNESFEIDFKIQQKLYYFHF